MEGSIGNVVVGFNNSPVSISHGILAALGSNFYKFNLSCKFSSQQNGYGAMKILFISLLINVWPGFLQ